MPETEDLKLSVVIPACNEEDRISSTLARVTGYLAATCPAFELLVVDDGSSDRTVALAERFAETDARVRVLPGVAKRGKGFAVRRGCLAARGRLVLYTDADLSTPIDQWERLRARLEEGHDVAIGARVTVQRPQPWRRRVVGRMFRRLRDWIAVSGFHDTQCGFKLFRRAAVRAIFMRARVDGFAFDVEALAIARMRALSVVEVPVVWVNESGTRVDAITDPVRMLVDLVRIRLNLIRGAYGTHEAPIVPISSRMQT